MISTKNLSGLPDVNRLRAFCKGLAALDIIMLEKEWSFIRHYCDVVEVCPIPTVDELNEKVWGEGFYATIISKGKFDEIWNTGIYNESLTAT